MNCVLMMNIEGKRVSKRNDDIKEKSSTKRGYMYKVSSIVYTRAPTHNTHTHPQFPTHDTSDESEDDDATAETDSLSTPHFTNKILKEGRMEGETQRILEEGKSDSPPPMTHRSIDRRKCRI